MRLATFVAVFCTLVATTADGQAPDAELHLFNVRVNSDGSPGEVDFGSHAAPVTLLFDGQVGKIIVAVYAQLSGATQAGISGAEFYVEGLEADQLPPGWTKSVFPAEGTTVLGDWSDPHFARGQIIRRVNITWPVESPDDQDCQMGPFVFLGRIEMQSPFGDPSFPAGTQALVVGGDPPSNPTRPCPILLLCDTPVFTAVCVMGTGLCIGLPDVPDPGNPFPPHQATDIAPSSILTWEEAGPYCCHGLGTPWTSVFFGTTADPPLALRDDSSQRSSFDPPDDLAANTTYFWRVSWTHDDDCGFASSPVWSFTTGNATPVETMTWQTVKQLFR